MKPITDRIKDIRVDTKKVTASAGQGGLRYVTTMVHLLNSRNASKVLLSEAWSRTVRDAKQEHRSACQKAKQLQEKGVANNDCSEPVHSGHG